MTEQPPRKRFQIHLSTAIVLMFVAGALIWANICAFGLIERFAPNPGQDWLHFRRKIFGFPFPGVNAWQDMAQYHGRSDVPFVPNRYSVNGLAVALDVAIFLAILFAVWFLLEWLIRRRAARKGS
ncbi:MAG TPA: hypothetical protein VKX17_14965 [Planctomycetota bacterium]|nr:hypothetical protein [Planctomycetota bacterium]